MENISTPECATGEIARLTQRLAAGEEKAFAEFHARYFDQLWRFLLVVTHGREQAAQDALQQTMLRVIRYVRVFEAEESFWCWLKMVARSSARDAGRAEQRYWAVLKKFAIFRSEQEPESVRGSEDRLQACLEETLNELRIEERQLLEGKYIEGHTIKELCSATGLTEKAVESRLLRLRRDVRERLLRKLRFP